ncbi:unnamed protein product, partial [Polarella glacialis]
CYGQQAFAMLSSLAELGRFDVEDFTRRVAEDVGRDSEYEVKGCINESNWPQRSSDVTMPLPGPWRHGSINKFLTNYVVEGKRYPKCGSDDAQIDFACRIVPVVALYAGRPELSHAVEVAIRAIQNTGSAVKFGLAFAKCLELLILGHAETPSAAVLSVVSSLKAADPEDAEAAGLERVLQDLAAMSLPEAALALKPKDHSLLMPLHAACYQASYEEAVENSIRAGGCTASRATLAGALFAAAGGRDVIPRKWITLAPCGAEVEKLAALLVAHRDGLASRRANEALNVPAKLGKDFEIDPQRLMHPQPPNLFNFASYPHHLNQPAVDPQTVAGF